MIKLERIKTPKKLTPDFVTSKTQEFILNKTNVWNEKWLKEILLDLSYGKCAYCECDLKVESNYMEVEHFEDKANNPNKVLTWDNLLPSCKRCNGSKSTHDVIAEPIINPFIDTPSKHLHLSFYRFHHLDLKGKNSIDVLNLNDTERVVMKRFEIGNKLFQTIEKAKERLETYETKNSIISRNKLLNIIKGILTECQRESEYSATCATILHLSDLYKDIRKKMQSLGIWNSELEVLHNESLNLKL